MTNTSIPIPSRAVSSTSDLHSGGGIDKMARVCYYDSVMKLKIYSNAKLDIKRTAKVYASSYTEKLLHVASKAIDKLDYVIVNH